MRQTFPLPRVAGPLVVALLAVALTACGGAGGLGGPSGPVSTQTKGNVTALDGSSADVGGVRVEVPDEGVTAFSGSDGRFDLGPLAAKVVTIEVTAPGAGGDGPATVEVDLSGGGSAVIRMTIEDGRVVRLALEHCEDDGSEVEARAPLVARLPGLEGHVEIERESDGDSEIEVEAEGLTPGDAVEMVILDGTGLESPLGTATADAFGEAEVELETGDGDTLPFGATDVAELEEMLVEVRDVATGAVLLAGRVPVLGSLPSCPDDDDDGRDDDLDDDLDDREGRTRLRNAAGVAGEARVRMRSRLDRDEEEFEVDVERTNVTDDIELWLEDPSSPGTLVFLGTLRPDDDDPLELEFERETDDGQTLPFGVASVDELTDLAVELRSAADGAVLYSGRTPVLNPL